MPEQVALSAQTTRRRQAVNNNIQADNGLGPLLNIPMARELMRMAEDTPFEKDPQFKAAVIAAAIRGDHELAARLKDAVSASLLENAVYPDLFPGPENVPGGELPLGRVVHRDVPGERVGISLSTLAKGLVLMTGMTGMGKTTLLISLLIVLGQRGVPFLFFDPENQAPAIIPVLGADKVGVLNYWELPFCPFGIPGVVPGKTPPAEVASAARIYYPRLIAKLANQWVGIGGENELITIIDELLCNALSSGRWPTMAEIIKALRARMSPSKRTRTDDYIRGLLNRLGGLSSALPGANCCYSNIAKYILKKPIIVRTQGLEASARAFLFDVLLLQVSFLLEQDLSNYDESKPKLVVPVEEANVMTRDSNLPAGPLLETIVTSGRKRGLIPVLVTQGLSQMSSLIIGNATTRFVFCLSDPASRAKLAGVLGLDAERDEAISTLPRKRYLLSSVDMGPEPLLIEADELVHPRLPDETVIRGWCERTLKEIDFENEAPPPVDTPPPAKSSQPPPVPAIPALPPIPFAVLADISGQVDTAENRAKRLNLSLPEESLARTELLKNGLIEEYPERIGKGRRFFTLTARGEELARAHGFKIHTYKSGPLHEFVVASIAAKACSSPGWTAQRDGITFNGVQLDALLCGPKGWRVGLQVNHCSNITPEADNLAKLTGATLDRILAVCTTKQKAARLMQKLAGLGVKVPGKVIVTDYDSFEAAKDVKQFVGSDVP
jgi:hypothetical protein